jgi:hypothetical protein
VPSEHRVSDKQVSGGDDDAADHDWKSESVETIEKFVM